MARTDRQLALDFTPPKPRPRPPDRFDGVTYDARKDCKRLSTLLDRVYALMADGTWRTLAQISEATGGSEASVSARLRDLRKPRFHGSRPNQGVDRARTDSGLWVYRVVVR